MAKFTAEMDEPPLQLGWTPSAGSAGQRMPTLPRPSVRRALLRPATGRSNGLRACRPENLDAPGAQAQSVGTLTAGARSSAGGAQASGDAGVCAPERMSLTESS